MKVAIITNEKIQKILYGFKIDSYQWNSTKIENLNLRDYDGIIIDLDTYSELSRPLDFEEDVLTPKVIYDVLKTAPSFYVIIGDPSQNIYRKSFLSASGFTGKFVRGSGTSHSLTDAGKRSIYKDYLLDIKKYNYSYEYGFSTSSEIKDEAIFGKYNSYTTIPIGLMTTKSGYLTAFSVQGKAWEKGYNNQEYDKYYVFESNPTFLPSHPAGSKYAIDMILRLLSDSGSTSDIPTWVEAMSVYGQNPIDEQIGLKQEAIKSLNDEKANLISQRDNIRKILEMLYLSDKPLEAALKRIFIEMGYEVGEPNTNNNVEFYLTGNSHEFVVEVKSTLKEHFNKDGLRQVVEWKDNEALETGKEFKPLLILSNEYIKPIQERNVDILDENLIAFAQSRHIAIISVSVLYLAIERVIKGDLNKNEFIDKIFDFDGLISDTDLFSV